MHGVVKKYCHTRNDTSPLAAFGGMLSTSVGDPVIPTIRIDPPYDSIIAKVITDNPGCPQCEASRTENGTFTREMVFQGRGPVRLRFVALDGEGKERCRGQTVELEALGPRP